jgi:hypothetical protein
VIVAHRRPEPRAEIGRHPITSSASHQALLQALRVILPTPEQTLVLRACLDDGAAGRAAWEAWQARTSDAKSSLAADRLGGRALLPSLMTSLRRSQASVDRSLLPYLRTAYAHEEARAHTYLRICNEALGALVAARIPTLVLKGAALAQPVYQDPALRHSHDIDILVDRAHLEPAATALRSAGFGLRGGIADAPALDLTLEHPSHLPLELHSRLFALPHYGLPLADVWSRARLVYLADLPARTLSPADHLLHICGHASYSPSRHSLRWVCDAWYLIDRHPDLDWDVVLDGAVRGRLALPLRVTLTYLAAALGAPIPPPVLDRVRAAAARTSRVDRDVALFGMRAGAREDVATLLARMPGGWPVRARVASWLLFPSRQYLRGAAGAPRRRALLFRYAARPVAYIGRRLFSHLRRSSPPADPSARPLPRGA